MKAEELDGLDGMGLADLVRRKEVTPLELVEVAIERAERLNPQIGAIIHPTYERGRDEARQVGGSQPSDRPLYGVPFLLKDAGGDQAGERSMTGLAALKKIDARAKEDSAIALFAREAGLLSIGRTNTPELALLPTTEPEAFGPSRNPWNLEYSSGGSSGGSAAAVAAGIVPIAHASDGGGSIRGPAAKCGLVGLKPSRGRTSLGPGRGEHWSSLSTHGVVSRTVRDTAAALDALARPFPGDPYHARPVEGRFADAAARPPGRLRIAFLAAAPRDIELHTETADRLDEMAEILEGLGHEIDIQRPPVFESVEPTMAYVRIVAANVARALEKVGEQVGRPLTQEDVEPLTWALASRGLEVSVTQHLADIELIHRFGRDLAKYQQEGAFDLLLSPTQALPPARLGEISSTPDEPLRAFVRAGPYGVFTLPFNLTGQPAISVPAGVTKKSVDGVPAGLPIGAQLVAPSGREDLLLSTAGQLEEERSWADLRPPVYG